MSEPAHGWTMPDESQDGLAAGDLSNSDVCARYVNRMMKEEYYNSPRFAIGYRELQTMWASGAQGSEKGGGARIRSGRDQNQMPERFPSALREDPLLYRDTLNTSKLKKSMVLPLENSLLISRQLHSSAMSFPTHSPHLEVPSYYRPTRKWSSSADASPLGTPSPVISEAPSPIPLASPCGSSTSSPRLGGHHYSRQFSNDVGSDMMTPGSSSECHLDQGPGCSSKGTKQKSNCVVDTLRRIVQNLKGQRTKASDKLPTDYQIAELESEVESYRQLSESKRRAADLLKHQLMEVLYEKVVCEVEERHKRRHLEEEMMGLEFELHLLRSNTEESIRTLKQQLQTVITEKASLQRQVHFRETDDAVPDYQHLLLDRQGTDFESDGTLRRASH